MTGEAERAWAWAGAARARMAAASAAMAPARELVERTRAPISCELGAGRLPAPEAWAVHMAAMDALCALSSEHRDLWRAMLAAETLAMDIEEGMGNTSAPATHDG